MFIKKEKDRFLVNKNNRPFKPIIHPFVDVLVYLIELC